MNKAPEHIRRVTVYASSSNGLARDYYDAAERLGAVLGRAGLDIVYGGGGVGLMGAMADRALAEGAHVHGVIPGFLNTVEHGHQDLSNLEVVTDMRERKQRMIEDSHAVIALPGGSGTLEELFEVITLKRLGQFLGPILMLNTNGYYERLDAFLRNAVQERFMLISWMAIACSTTLNSILVDSATSVHRMVPRYCSGVNADHHD